MPVKKTTAASAEKTVSTKPATPKAESVVQEQPVMAPREEPTVFRVKEAYTPEMYIPVKNGFSGKLVYRSKKTGERYIWEGFGDEQDMELAELKNAKSASRSFFENNWFMFDGPEVIAYLGVERYYKHALPLDKFDDLFEMKPDALKEKVAQLSSGQRASVAYRARQKIKDEEIDSLKVITALEECLGIELIER